MRRASDILFARQIKAPGAETASTTGAGVDLGVVAPNQLEPVALLDIYAVSGTPTLDLVIQGSNDGTTWETAGTFAQKTAAGKDAIAVKPFRRYRYASTIGGGTPSVSYHVEVVGLAPAAPAATPYA